MDKKTRFNLIKDALKELSEESNNITLDQVIKKTGIEDPGPEIEILWKRGYIIRITDKDFKWV